MRPVIEIDGVSSKGDLQYSVLLRRWQIEDAASIFKQVDRNRSHLDKWLPWVRETQGVEDSAKFVKGSIEAFESRTRFEYGIFLRPICSNTQCLLIGAVGLVSCSTEGKAEIGYWLAQDMQGNGIVTMAVKALIEEAKSSLGVSQFVVKVQGDNWKSRKIPERLGFVEKRFADNELSVDGCTSKMIEYHLQ